MDDSHFEGTIVLESLAALDLVDEFFEAIDDDDFDRASLLMKRAGIDPKTIAIVLQKMAMADGDH